MDCARCTAFRLHLGDLGNHTPQVCFAAAGPFVTDFGHRRTWRDGKDRDRLTQTKRNRRRRLIAINRDLVLFHPCYPWLTVPVRRAWATKVATAQLAIRERTL